MLGRLIQSFSNGARVGTSIGSDPKLRFKRSSDGDDKSKPEKDSSFFDGLKRFFPWISRAKQQQSYTAPQTTAGMRYHFRLLKPDVNFKRHVITRMLR
jgi:hypothetical protein